MSEPIRIAASHEECLSALRTLRDCGVVLARGRAMKRFNKLVAMGLAVNTGTRFRATYRLTALGKAKAA